MRQFRGIFWTGLAVRLFCIPFLLEWFHADERQMLEFAHFHAHGRLHPFMESKLHLRNQTLPWLFSWLIRACDQLGLNSPHAYLISMDLVIAIWTWLGFWALLTVFKESLSDAQQKLVRSLGWFFALFWGFVFYYSRPLLEVVLFAPACFLLLAVRRRQAFRAGFWAGVAGVFRYPSILWAGGAALVWIFEGSGKSSKKESPRQLLSSILLGGLGLGCAVALGGCADFAIYGKFLESAPAYWSFNHPGGPVSAMFGNDSLWAYFKWFRFLFTPWLAPFFLAFAAWALFRIPVIGLFCLPYFLGHVWTPHREARFMLPVTPFLVLSVAWALAAMMTSSSERLWMFKILRWRELNIWPRRIVAAHLALNFAWYPLNIWAQWRSGQGVLLRNYSEIASEAKDLVTLADPLIDAWVPEGVRWGDAECRWHRPELLAKNPSGKIWVLSRKKLPNCRMKELFLPQSEKPTMGERVFRVRFAQLWVCDQEILSHLCPGGWTLAPPEEPQKSLSK